ncbi:MAG: HAMP domain-containing protein, partial [Bacteroidetes bacterium]|nr:HAMP domain-containing protein [Bacteroidota bacterium]
VPAMSRDEIGELSFSFNQMSEELKKSRLAIEEYNKTLEHHWSNFEKNPKTNL